MPDGSQTAALAASARVAALFGAIDEVAPGPHIADGSAMAVVMLKADRVGTCARASLANPTLLPNPPRQRQVRDG